ncbi:MAG: pinensin family lanthipeptide [Bacteroidota bacterium]
MKKRRLKLDELKIKSFTTSEVKSITAGRMPIDDIPPGDTETIPTWDASGCNSAIELNCQYTQNNEVGCA